MVRRVLAGLRTRRMALTGVLWVLGIAALMVAPTSLALAAAGPAAAQLSVAVRPLSGAVDPNPYVSGMPATVVIGQTGLDRNVCPTTVGANTTCGPAYATFDADGNLWVADRSDNRILEYTPPFETNMSASLVLGQATFTTHDAATTQSGLNYPSGLAFDAAGDLWVTDSDNYRVVEYVPPFHDGMDASLVLGQASFTTGTLGAINATNLDFPETPLVSPAGDLFVSDYDHNRILEYQPPFTDDESPSVVLGQQNFTWDVPRSGATGLSEPLGMTFSPSGDLWVTDEDHYRLVEFTPPFTTNESASVELGQVNFTALYGGDGSTNLTNPWGIGVDARGDVWAADYSNNRLVEYLPPFTDGKAASVVLGQAGFGTDAAGISAYALRGPREVAFDAQGDLWTVDQENNRVLEYVPAHFGVEFTESGLPSGTQWSVAVGPFVSTSTSTGLAVATANGSYTFQAEASGGYTASPSSGTVTVNGTASSVAISFSSSSSSGSSFLWIVVAAILAVIAVVEAVLLVRRRPKGARPPPTPVSPAPTPPPGAGGGSSGGAGLPPPSG